MTKSNTGSESLRKRRDIFRTTDEEQEQIKAFARDAGMSVNKYLITCALEGRPAPRQDHQRKLQKTIQVAKCLEEIAHAVSTWPADRRGLVLLLLREIERFILDESSDSSEWILVPDTDEAC